MATPSEPPPSYEQVAGRGRTTNLQVPESRNGISPRGRRSMEDERRDLPAGWIRQYDDTSHHQFFVDTTKEPPRSIWHHPYDDEEYLKTLSPNERDRVTRLHHSISLKDIAAESSDDEAGPSSRPIRGGAGAASSSAAGGSSSVASTSGEPAPTGLHRYTRKLKDRVTNTTHEERNKEREQRAKEEYEAYQAHNAFRKAMSEAIRTGQPQFLGRHPNGHDIYIEPPNGPAVPMGARGINPYSTGVYANPNAKFVRPNYAYNRYVASSAPSTFRMPLTFCARPYGYGYGGGYGFPVAGGLLGGMMLGGLLF